ncbi:LuxR C-terminal-related transcriptional regulator [Actinokineospora auranticolor]|uniref:DNA-binding NarL/FixJ family response regulator n=1 Tax=Actinokineospora auranticolor TaxID=155976 RepID=A0A2S6GYU3_9PSEU|nr:LuxR C-terminal-related transcriptional regulator [Actinokineospora auranticolor]PPK70405.1 DNA-binding NarL/FixJ family response regulator [Actinokineospora auranticolor]
MTTGIEPRGSAGGGLIRLGLIDNDRMLLATTEGWFAANAPGMRIEHKASTVAEYLALEPADDLVLLDLRLDDSTRFVDNISRLVQYGTAVLLLSAHTSRDVKLDAIRAGAVDFHPKGDLVGLVQAVADIAANRYVLGQELAFAISRDRGPGSPDLSERQTEAAMLRGRGLQVKEIAKRMNVTPKTVEGYLERVKAKYQDADRPYNTAAQLRDRLREDGAEL